MQEELRQPFIHHFQPEVPKNYVLCMLKVQKSHP